MVIVIQGTEIRVINSQVTIPHKLLLKIVVTYSETQDETIKER
jgi:hypothetical protein